MWLLIAAGLYLGWDALVVLDMDYHLFWTVSRPHYEIAFTIETRAGTQTARSVVEPVYFSAHAWDKLLPPIPDFGIGPPAFGRMLNGEAAATRLPDGKVVCMLLKGQLTPKGIPGKVDYIFELADKLLTHDDRIPFPHYGRAPFIDSHTAMLISGSAEIPLDLVPSMVVFLDGADRRSAHLVDPTNPEKWLGPGTKFLGARISVTKAPVSSDLQAFLPWLAKVEPTGHQPFEPIDDETSGAHTPGMWWDLLLYRSRI
jgi:hypothetical protein